MSYQALYRVWRPEKFSDIVGQDPIVTTLVNQIESGRIPHAYLFCGSRGTGKTTTAKVLARAMNCMQPLPFAEPCGHCEACIQLQNESNMDVMEIDAASNNGVDEIRDLREKIKYPPSVGRYKVYIIDEVHMLSTGAFNALLKTLEEPPAHAVFILATTEPQRLPATILSRCQRFDFKRIPAAIIVERLKRILASLDTTADEDALEALARAAEGGMRDAISLMDMCLSYADTHLNAATVREALGTSDSAFLFAFAGAMMQNEAGRAFQMIDEVIRDGRDAAVFAREVTGHIRSLLIAQFCGDELAELLEVAKEDANRLCEQSGAAPREKLLRMMDLFIHAESDMKWFSQPRSVLELCVARCCHPERELQLDTLAERVGKLEGMVQSGAVYASPGEIVPPKQQSDITPRTPKVYEKAAVTPKAAPQKPDAPNLTQNEDAEHWQAVVKRIASESGSMRALVESCVFVRRDENRIVLAMPKKWRMYLSVLNSEAKKKVVEQCLSDEYKRPMSMQLTLEGDTAPAAVPAAGRQVLQQVYDVFGRENVTVVED